MIFGIWRSRGVDLGKLRSRGLDLGKLSFRRQGVDLGIALLYLQTLFFDHVFDPDFDPVFYTPMLDPVLQVDSDFCP